MPQAPSFLPLAPLAALLAVAPAAHAANPLGPGITVREVAAPPQLVSGISSISVGKISGDHGSAIAASMVAALQDDERTVGRGTAADIAGDVVQVGAMVGGQMLASKLGGIGGKATSKITDAAGGIVADKVRGDKITLEDGLTVSPFPYKKSGGQGVLSGTVAIEAAESRSEKKEALTDDSGAPVKDADGNTVMITVQCLKRTATATFQWSLDKGSSSLLSGDSTETRASEKCGDEIGDVLSVSDLGASATAGMGHRVVTSIKPAWRSQRIGLRKAKDLAAPLRSVRKGDHEQALCLFHHVTEQNAEHGIARANLAAVHEAMGHHEAASAAYTAALEAGGPKRLAEKGLERVTARAAEVQSMVDAYALTWSVAPPQLDACPALPEGEIKLVKKPHSIELAGETLELAKGEMVFLQSVEGATAKVQLMDGTPVELPAKSLK